MLLIESNIVGYKVKLVNFAIDLYQRQLIVDKLYLSPSLIGIQYISPRNKTDLPCK